MAAEFLQQLLARFQSLLFSEALLCALGDALALEDAEGVTQEYASQLPKQSGTLIILEKVGLKPHNHIYPSSAAPTNV